MRFVRDQLTGLLPKEAKLVLRRTTGKVAAQIRKGMRARVQKREGVLRRAIISKSRRGTRDTVEAAVFITKGLQAKWDGFYWHFVEYGTANGARAYPFIEPTVTPIRANYKAVVRDVVKDQVLKALEKRAKKQQRNKP